MVYTGRNFCPANQKFEKFFVEILQKSENIIGSPMKNWHFLSEGSSILNLLPKKIWSPAEISARFCQPTNKKIFFPKKSIFFFEISLILLVFNIFL